MNLLASWIQLAGVIHLAIIGANFALPRKLKVRESLAPMRPILRQIFVVHWVYIVIVLGMFALLCLLFPQDLAGGRGIGRFLSSCLCLFWGLRIVLQLVVYDRAVRRANRFLDAVYLLALGYFAVVFGVAAFYPQPGSAP
jgi:hypothetical protein